jgi:hypothetical protein
MGVPFPGGGTFWTQSPNRDPKRGFRFRVEIGSSGPLWYAKKADKPVLSLEEAKHEYLNHTYYWPGRISWNTIKITFTDPVEPDLAGGLIQAMEDAGVRIPAGVQDSAEFRTPSKKSVTDQYNSSAGALGAGGDDIRVIQIDEDGNDLEMWTLKHAWVKNIEFGSLDYSSDDLTEVTVEFRYDWAEFFSGATAGYTSKFAVGGP